MSRADEKNEGLAAAGTRSAAPALACRDLTFRYAEGDEPVFERVSLTVGKGEVVLVMGASGCGKSTLAYCLAGLYPDYAGVLEGSVEVEGHPVAELGPQERSRAVSILFQNPDNQFCMDTVRHEVLFALENVDYAGDLEGRAAELLREAGLWEYAERPVRELSGGTKQKLALVTALATGARTLVLDEPFANLDPISCRRLAGELRTLNERGITLLVPSRPPRSLPVVTSLGSADFSWGRSGSGATRPQRSPRVRPRPCWRASSASGTAGGTFSPGSPSSFPAEASRPFSARAAPASRRCSWPLPVPPGARGTSGSPGTWGSSSRTPASSSSRSACSRRSW